MPTDTCLSSNARVGYWYMKSAAAIAFSLMLLCALCGCKNEQGQTMSVSLAGQPSPIHVTVGATTTASPSISYRGTATALLITYNVVQAPNGGSVTITPRSLTLTVANGIITSIPTSTLVFNAPGTYVVQVVVQEEVGSGGAVHGGAITSQDQQTYVAGAAG